MSVKESLVNERIRRRIRRIRIRHDIKMTELAAKLRMPISSYASMETGQCRISLDHLHRILAALDTDIGEVWPSPNAAEGCQNRFYLRRLQEFRLNELISLNGAEGGAIFHVGGSRCEVLFHENLSDFLIDRLVLYLERDLEYGAGTWLGKRTESGMLCVFLKSENCPQYVLRLAEKYLTLWIRLIRKGGLLERAEPGPAPNSATQSRWA